MLSNSIQVYLPCALLPVLAFLYLIYHFYFITKKSSQIQTNDIVLYHHLISNIQGVIRQTCVHQPSLKSQPNHKQPFCKKKQCKLALALDSTDCCTSCVSNKKYKYLPHAVDGISEMKQINKTLITERKQQLISVIRIKRKKILENNYLAKFGYHKTVLPIIFEDLQY